eukprot:TRINITY_DN1186_c0_g1_i1.p1 TRINITY_DN1186_c0_g1~~TRINITY_DN1186_c0_g1_i1.p1  ORF type:complete len:256 (+),score=46.48 TRINITY_DN1186_c0_g1_i1:151-918(+)
MKMGEVGISMADTGRHHGVGFVMAPSQAKIELPDKPVLSPRTTASTIVSASPSRKVVLNVGGTRFETLVDTCTKHGRDTMLGALFLAFNAEQKDEYFIDRDPELFRHILNWYRTGVLFCPQGLPVQVMQQELDYFGIPRSEMRIFQKQFTLAGKKVWSCRSCGVHLADNRDLVSKGFTGKTGEAYLFESIVNCSEGDIVDKELMTGKHQVTDVTCNNCGAYVGWTYLKAFNEENKYKEGKSVLEKSTLVKEKNIH